MAYYKCGSVYTTQNSNTVIDTASGPIANFKTQLAMPLIDAQIDVNAVQDLHGQSGAYPPCGGVNKWNEEWELGAWSSVTGEAINYTDRIRCKNLIPVLPSTSYCIRFGATASSVVNAYDENEDFIENLTTGTFGTGGRVITTPANCHFIKFSVGTAYGTTYNNDISVNYPSTDTAYHPYSNICPINGRDEVKVVGCGKNLFDGASIVYGYPLNAIIEAGSFMRIVFSRCKPNTSYTISKIQSQRFSVFWCEDLPAIGVSISSPITNNFATSITVTTGATAKYICAFVYNQNVDTLTPEEILSSVQIEEGSQATTYEPYNGSTTVIQLNNTYYGGRFIQDKSGKRELVVTHNIIDLGDLNYSSIPCLDSTKFRKSGLLPTNIKGAPTPSSINTTSLCEIYTATIGDTLYLATTDGITLSTVGNVIIYDNRYNQNDDNEQFKLAVKGIKLVYPLAEPFTVALTDGEPIKSLPGVNNIFADTGDTAVKFRKIGE